MKNNRNAPEVSKPFLTGAPTDEYTLRSALKFFGMTVLILIMTFLVCSLTGFKSTVIRIIVNLFVEGLVLTVLYYKGAELGEDAVARGEILYQHDLKGENIAPSERRIPYHPLKGFLIGLIGSSLILVIAVILALTAERQMTGIGAMPSWTDAFMRRSELRDAVAYYSESASATVTDFLRIIVRILIMPFVSIAGSENRDLMLTFERISPLLVLLPGIAYGTGYLQGPRMRSRVHTEIATNKRKRIAREKREMKARKARIPQGPQQLN